MKIFHFLEIKRESFFGETIFICHFQICHNASLKLNLSSADSVFSILVSFFYKNEISVKHLSCWAKWKRLLFSTWLTMLMMASLIRTHAMFFLLLPCVINVDIMFRSEWLLNSAEGTLFFSTLFPYSNNLKCSNGLCFFSIEFGHFMFDRIATACQIVFHGTLHLKMK